MAACGVHVAVFGVTVVKVGCASAACLARKPGRRRAAVVREILGERICAIEVQSTGEAVM
jgi:hypothetical protein